MLSYCYLISLYSSSLTASSHSLDVFSPGSPFTSSLYTSFARLKAAFCCAIMLNEIVVNMMNIAIFFIFKYTSSGTLLCCPKESFLSRHHRIGRNERLLG